MSTARESNEEITGFCTMWKCRAVSVQDDEYDRYAPYVARLAIEGKGSERIARGLSEFARDNMGMAPNREDNLKVAVLIVKTKREMLDD